MSRGEKKEDATFMFRLSSRLRDASRIAAEENGEKLSAWVKKAMRERIGMSSFEAKKKIVESGASAIFENWRQVSGIEEQEFLDALEWVCDDPHARDGKLEREIGLVVTPDGEMKRFMLSDDVPEMTKRAFGREWDDSLTRGRIVKLKRVYYEDGSFAGFYLLEDDDGQKAGTRWRGNVSLSARDAI